MKNSFEIFL